MRSTLPRSSSVLSPFVISPLHRTATDFVFTTSRFWGQRCYYGYFPKFISDIVNCHCLLLQQTVRAFIEKHKGLNIYNILILFIKILACVPSKLNNTHNDVLVRKYIYSGHLPIWLPLNHYTEEYYG